MRFASAVTGSLSSLAIPAAIALVLGGADFVTTASAQTMGEYGGVTANSAAAASQMPKIEPPDLGRQENSGSDPSPGPTHTEEIRTYQIPATDRSNEDKDADTDSSQEEWQQVK